VKNNRSALLESHFMIAGSKQWNAKIGYPDNY